MARVLITGMSGSGKSSVTAELARRGRRAVDLDAPEWSEWVDADPSDVLTPAAGRDWVWRGDKTAALLSDAEHGELFVSGCASNMMDFYSSLDLVVLLSAPVETIMARLSARRDGYGVTEDDRRRTAELIATVEPRLRAVADCEIRSDAPVEIVVDVLLRSVADHAFRSTASAKVAGRHEPGGAGQRLREISK